MILRSLQRGRDGVHERVRSREPRAQQFVHRFQIIAERLRRAGGHRPADAPAGHQVGLRQPVERDDRKIGRKSCNGDVLAIFVDDQLVVDLVGEDEQVVAARQLNHPLQRLARVDRARGVVGIDQQNRLGARVDARRDVFDVGLPAVLLAEEIRIRLGAELAQHGPIERIVGAGRQHVVARIEQRGQTVVDDLAGAEADHDALDILKACGLGLGADGVEGGAFAERVAIAVKARAHRPFGSVDQVRRRGKVELSGIADVEVEDLVTLARNLIGNDGEVADGIAYVGHAAGRGNVVLKLVIIDRRLCFY